ncbi:MAG: diguanylate cyclase [Candidatus Riflebacteria bacterium]|nr:diguanylate cyclase [Candidatus Riflebacteria bacterium]
MKHRWFDFGFRLDLVLMALLALGYVSAHSLHYPIPFVPFLLIGLMTISVMHVIVYYKILLPLRRFAEIADNVADGDLHQKFLPSGSNELEEIHNSFTKIVGSLLDSREAIENYIKTIGDINKQLEIKVDSLSVLYSASKSMGASLSVDGLARTFLTLIIERLHVTGAAVLLYNEKNDMVTTKDILGFSPELFARFRFYSDNKIITNMFNETCGFWVPDETSRNLMNAEFETDAVRALRLFLPMRIKDHFVGVIVLGEKKDAQPYNEADHQLILALAGLATTAINNATLYEKSEETKNELDRKVFNLMTLQQSGKVLSSTLNIDSLLTMAIDMFLETVWANRGVLMLMSEDNLKFEVKASKGLDPKEMIDLENNPAETWAMTALQKDKRPIFSHELAEKAKFQSYTIINRQLPFAVYVPLLKEGELYGVVKIGAKINGENFNENDLEFFSTLSSQVVISFENARLYSLAITDSITKLYIHRYFQLRLDEEVKRSRRYNSTLTLLMCDIDNFKHINDNYGHQQGDTILKEISMILRKNIRSTDIAARYGGEEFVIILPETTQSDAKIVAERIRRDVAKFEFPSLVADHAPIHTTISIGVAGFPLNANDKDELIRKADSSMYKAKDSGRNKVILCGIDN